MSKRLFTFMLVLLILGAQAFAQRSVSGKVTDASGEPLVGVAVQIKGTNTGTSTDMEGNWSLNSVRDNAVLVFSSIGYATQEVTVGAQRTINLVLKDDTTFLDEVVVVGYGTARARDVSGSISSVKYADKEISNLPNPNALVALSSKVAGMKYNPTNSAGGDNTGSMNIRGKNSIVQSSSASRQGVNSPLFVVDGVIFHGSINEISNSDIQSIDVLKDASAAAIYGSRAANGVIIITTKRGSTEKPTVRFGTQLSISDWSRMPKMVSSPSALLSNRYNHVKTSSSTLDAYPDSYSQLSGDQLSTVNGILMNTVEQQAYDQGVWTNWMDEVTRKGTGQKYDLSVSGQNKYVNYYISGDYTLQKGIMKGNDYEKYDIMSKLEGKINDYVTVGLKGNFLSAKSWGQSPSLAYAMWYSPFSFVKVGDNAKNKELIEGGYGDWYSSAPDGNVASPFIGSAAADSYLYTSREGHNYNLNGVFFSEITQPWIDGLSYRFTLSGQRNTSRSDVFNSPSLWVDTTSPSQMDNPSQYLAKVSGSSSMSQYGSWTLNHLLSYNVDFLRNHHFDAMVGYEREASNSEGLSTSYSKFSTPVTLKWYIQSYSNQDTKGIGRTRTRTQTVSYLARANYNYRQTYYLTFNFRRDGYSAFADGHKWGNFYGASAAWVLSNENFLKDNVSWIDFLKLRASYGQNGSRSVSAYATNSTLSSWYTWLDDKSTLGFIPNNLPNRTLTWATVTKFDVGLDFSVLKNRLDGSIDVYTGKTTDMLVSRSVPYPSGYQSASDNVGKVTNKGIEITLHSVNLDGNGSNTLRWESDLTFDSNTNKIVSLFGKNYAGEETDDVANATAYGFDSYYALMVGHPIAAAYDLKKLGIFQNEKEIKDYKNADGTLIQPDAKPGDIKFEDTNKDGKIDANDRAYLGTQDPLFTVNFGNTFTWKNFSLYFSFRWMQGDDTHFLGYDPYAFTYHNGIQLKKYHAWMKEGDGNKYPKSNYGNSLDYQFWNDRSFLKLKDLSFSYNFDQKLVSKIGLQGLRLYFSGTDLFTITNWSGLDPEDGGTLAAGSASGRFVRNGTYRTFTFGATITF
ncbi:MAG: TonB-dependent receptor [Bacteroidales bacterium]|nr:TonB-dependent receptor [Bacteroidales bacterium]